MKAKKADPARQPAEVTRHSGGLEPAAIEDGAPLEDAYVSGGPYAGTTIARLSARRSIVEGVNFSEATLRSVKLRDVRLIRCDFSNAVLRGLEASRVEFIDCRLLGIKAAECRLEHVLFERCDARYAQLPGGAAPVSEFVATTLDEADLRGVNLEHTRWTASSLARADLTGARLAGADLRGAAIEGMIAAAADVFGAIVTPGQAMDLARLLGVVIR